MQSDFSGGNGNSSTDHAVIVGKITLWIIPTRWKVMDRESVAHEVTHYTQPGKSRTKKADEISLLDILEFLIVLFRIFRESD
uniref:Uncharacterized protein n=1 Tax=Candidatus Kentrum sp. MB TaxID=2138164 RepID=A0A450XL44_9GAMM|nr:MAG: hypothetical protein BECKMB1821G_GA0114241_101044 [Candidatus Kentron sp. MB]VFK30055.1 MAG: hypothetical protein BECKMB1821I_GA0114274_101328 [Candidatus Kentron sp. MB]VFK75032.1 MAG: hypothetical protein BECKMB1821H_GA0114242_101428 [Candidatus Kentron sp. MB]